MKEYIVTTEQGARIVSILNLGIEIDEDAFFGMKMASMYSMMATATMGR